MTLLLERGVAGLSIRVSVSPSEPCVADTASTQGAVVAALPIGFVRESWDPVGVPKDPKQLGRDRFPARGHFLDE